MSLMHDLFPDPYERKRVDAALEDQRASFKADMAPKASALGVVALLMALTVALLALTAWCEQGAIVWLFLYAWGIYRTGKWAVASLIPKRKKGRD